ncbi:Gamma-glutamyltranspeptidase [gamma proteobacterium IMCC2047]|nr:Gamma-glutamyltranspeptidase [gamma proteobacterium IMCC2047]
MAQILNILENFEVANLSKADRYHVLAEAMKLAFADRAYWLGDPDFTDVPRGLIDKQYARQLAQRIDLARTINVSGPGAPPDAEVDLFGKHTTHIATADSQGNWVAITSTVNTSFGSKVIIPGTGVIMNNQMDDFSAQPGVQNAFGLVGAEANSIAPGKRPLSSMSPTIVLKDGKPVMTLGAAGGPTIITQVVQALVNVIDLGMAPEEAVAAPRIHNQWLPDKLFVESDLSTKVKETLEQRGHKLKQGRHRGATQFIGKTNAGGFVSVSEPRLQIN